MSLTDEQREQCWIQTYTGKRFSLVEPRVEDVDILDIAVALARVPRFAGHTRWMYSVAQHSYYASLIVPPPLALEALLHDAAEAYTGDITRPLKLLLGVEFAAIEYRVHAAIAERFGLPPAMSPQVKEADDRLLLAERRDLMLTPPQPWKLATPVEPWRQRIHLQGFTETLGCFLMRFKELSGEPLPSPLPVD